MFPLPCIPFLISMRTGVDPDVSGFKPLISMSTGCTRSPIYGSPCPSVTKSQSLVDLTDVSPVDEDANSILADDTNRAIPGNLEMQVAPPGDQI